MNIIGIFLPLLLAALFLLILYQIIKIAVKNGVLEAYDEIKKDR